MEGAKKMAASVYGEHIPWHRASPDRVDHPIHMLSSPSVPVLTRTNPSCPYVVSESPLIISGHLSVPVITGPLPPLIQLDAQRSTRSVLSLLRPPASRTLDAVYTCRYSSLLDISLTVGDLNDARTLSLPGLRTIFFIILISWMSCDICPVSTWHLSVRCTMFCLYVLYTQKIYMNTR